MMNEDNSELDSFLKLLGPDGESLDDDDDDSGDNLNSKIARFELPETNTYTIVAYGYNNQSTGAYELTLLVCSSNPNCQPIFFAK